MTARYRLTALLAVPLMLAGSYAFEGTAHATPAFARKQQLACGVCHTVFPELTAAGRTYKENGYRFPDDQDPKGQKAVTNGTDLGGGIIVDALPGLAVKVGGSAITAGPDDSGAMALSSTPLDSLELVMSGISGKRWSYFGEVEAAADDGYGAGSPNGMIQYRANRALSVFVGWTPTFSRDGYNALSESRRIDHTDHALDFAGSTDMVFSDNSGIVGVYGRASKVWYMAGVTPGPGVLPGTDDPVDAFARTEIDLSKKVGVGAFVYSGNTATDSTIRAAVDFNATTGAGTITAAGMYDTLDQATCVEAGWNDGVPAGDDLILIPEARFNLVVAGGGVDMLTPVVGLAGQMSSGRVTLEVSDDLSGGNTLPTINLAYDAIF